MTGQVQAHCSHNSRQYLAFAVGLKAIAFSLILFLVLLIALRHLQPKGIILYQGVVLAAALSAGQLLWERHRGVYWLEAAKDALLAFVLAYCFLFTVPTTVDRAYSVKMLMAIGQSDRGLTREEINNLFVQGLVARGGVDKRLLEQTSTGSIQFENGRYSLTPFGHLLDATFRIAQWVFACQNNAAIGTSKIVTEMNQLPLMPTTPSSHEEQIAHEH